MPICKKCDGEFPNKIVIDGEYRSLHNRKYCLNCSPFGGHNTKSLESSSTTTKTCPMCTKCLPLSNFYKRRDGRPGPYCIQCSNKEARSRQRSIKQQCVDYKGGKCSACNYNKYVGALEFHHTDPEHKDFAISKISCKSFAKLKPELDKCVLLCSNCHKEEHARMKGIYTPQEVLDIWPQ